MMYLESASRTMAGLELVSKPSEHWAFSPGRCAELSAGGASLGRAGEVRPESIAAFGVGVLVSWVEVDLSALYELL